MYGPWIRILWMSPRPKRNYFPIIVLGMGDPVVVQCNKLMMMRCLCGLWMTWRNALHIIPHVAAYTQLRVKVPPSLTPLLCPPCVSAQPCQGIYYFSTNIFCQLSRKIFLFYSDKSTNALRGKNNKYISSQYLRKCAGSVSHKEKGDLFQFCQV